MSLPSLLYFVALSKSSLGIINRIDCAYQFHARNNSFCGDFLLRIFVNAAISSNTLYIVEVM